MRARAVALVCFLVVAVIPVPRRRHRQAPLATIPGNWFGGLNQNAYLTATVGSQATITWQPPDTYCQGITNVFNEISEWVMIKGPIANDLGYIQSGIEISQQSNLGYPPNNNQAVCMFSEYTEFGPTHQNPVDGWDCTDVQPIGTPVVYFNQYFQCGSINCVRMGANIYGVGTIYDGLTPFDPKAVWFGISDGYSTETKYTNTYSPGNVSMPVLFANVASQASISSGFTSPPPGTLVTFTPEHPNTCVSSPLFNNAFNSYHIASGNGC